MLQIQIIVTQRGVAVTKRKKGLDHDSRELNEYEVLEESFPRNLSSTLIGERESI